MRLELIYMRKSNFLQRGHTADTHFSHNKITFSHNIYIYKKNEIFDQFLACDTFPIKT